MRLTIEMGDYSASRFFGGSTRHTLKTRMFEKAKKKNRFWYFFIVAVRNDQPGLTQVYDNSRGVEKKKCIKVQENSSFFP